MISDVEPNHPELVWFSRQMFWQIAGSTATFYGTTAGAFILACENTTHEPPSRLLLIGLSDFTPTVGLGCWSGGYTIYIVIATVIFAIELLLWWCRAIYPNVPRWIPHCMRSPPFESFMSDLFGHVRCTLDRQNSDRWVISARVRLRTLRKTWLALSFTDRLGVILRLLEIGNTFVLAYIIVAPSIGAYSVRKAAKPMPKHRS